MRVVHTRLLIAATTVALLVVNVFPDQTVAPVQASPSVTPKPTKPVPQPVIRKLNPSHTAVTELSFVHRQRRHVSWPRHLYGPTPNLAVRPGGHRGHATMNSTRASFIPIDNRVVKARRAHARRATAGCPTGWTCTDIGSDSPSGSSTYSGSGGSLSALGITAGGPGINDSLTSRSTQGFYYVYQSETSTAVSLSAQVTGQTKNGSNYDTSGVAIRSGTSATSAYYMAYAVPTNGTTTQGGIYVDYQSANSGTPVNLAYVPETTSTVPGNTDSANTCITGTTASCYLAVERINAPYRSQELEAYWSNDGTHWQAIAGSLATLSGSTLTGTIDVGAYATSDSSGNSSTANFSSVSLATSDIFDEEPTSCPPTYQCAAVGSSVTGGQWSAPSNIWQPSSPWTVAGSGSGLASTATSDNFQWDYQPINGDGNVSAQVGAGYEFPTPGSNYGVAQYGVQIRASTAASAPYFAAFVSPCQGLGLSYRTSSGGSATLTWKTTPPTCTSGNEENGLGPTASVSVRVARSGTSYQAYYNSGSGWTSYGSSQTISAISSQAPAGIFSASTYSNWQAWANFSNVVVAGDQPTSQEQIGGDGGLSAFTPNSDYNGNYTETDSDISILGGRGLPLGFSRTYNSLLAPEAATTLSPFGNLGPGWMDNYDTFATADSAGDVTIQNADGSQVTYTYSGGTYAPATHILATLQSNTGQTLAPQCPATALVLTLQDQSKLAYYATTGGSGSQPNGALCEQLDINGYPTELTYDSSSRLTTVTAYTDWNGSSFDASRYLTLAYSGSGTQIQSVTSSANTGTGTLEETYTYSSKGLATASDADGNTTHYTGSDESLLIDIQTPNQYAAGYGTKLYYDTAGRLLYSQDAVDKSEGIDGVTSYVLDCSLANPNTCSSDGTQVTTTVDPLGNETQEVYVDGMLTSQTQGVGTSVSATTNYSYDQSTLGTNTTTAPADGSGTSYEISYTNWYGTGSGSYGNVQCSISPGAPPPLVVTGGSYSGTTATLTFSSTVSPPAPNSTIYVSGVSPSQYNGDLTVNSSTSSSVTYTAGSTLAANPSGGSIALTEAGLAVTSATQTMGIATLTFASSPSPAVGGTIVVSGVSNPAYNGTFQVTGSSSTTVQYAVVGSPGSSSGGSFYEMAGDVTSYTYNSYNETVSTTNPDEQSPSYGGTCNTGTPTYTSTDYYGSAGGTACTNSAPDPWLVACSVEQTGGSPASATTNFAYASVYGGGADNNNSDLVATTDPKGDRPTVSAYDSYGNEVATYAPGNLVRAFGISSGSYTSTSCGGLSYTTKISFSTKAYSPPVGSTISVYDIVPTGYDGVFTVTASTPTSVSFCQASAPGTYSSGGDIQQIQTYGTVSGATWSSSTHLATVTFSGLGSAPFPGSVAVIHNIVPTGFDGAHSVVLSTSSSVTYSVSTSPGTYQSGGQVYDLEGDVTTDTYEPNGLLASTTEPNGNAPGATSSLWTTNYTYDAVGNSVYETDPGTTLNLTGASWSSAACYTGGPSGTATLSFSSAANPPPAGAYVSVANVSVGGYNGSYPVASSSSSSVKYCEASALVSGSGGSLVQESVNLYDPDENIIGARSTEGGLTNYSFNLDENELAESDAASNNAVSTATWSSTGGGQATLTLTSATSSPPAAGSSIVVAGVSVSQYNGLFSVLSSTSTTVTYADLLSTSPGSGTGGNEGLASASYTYDADGNQLTSTDYGSTAGVTTYEYDPLGRQSAATVPGTGLTTTNATCTAGVATISYSSTSSYPAVGSYVVVLGVAPAGFNGVFPVLTANSTSLTYDLSCPGGSQTTAGTASSGSYSSYYPDGGLDLSVDPVGAQTLSTYYPGGQTEQTVTGYGTSGAETETLTYDPNGSVITDQIGSNLTTSTYNDAGWTLTSQDNLANTTSYVYDADGNVTQETDPGQSLSIASGGTHSGTTATLMFSPAFPAGSAPSTSATIVVTGVSPSDYDGRFTIASSTSNSISYTFGGSTSNPSATGTISIPTVTHNVYNTGGQLFSTCTDGVPANYLCSSSGVLPQLTNIYDDDGNVVSVNDAGNGTSSGGTTDSWRQTSYTDMGGTDLAQVQTPPEGASDSANLTYTPDDQLSTLTNPDGVKTTYAYDLSGRVTKVTYSDSTPTVTYSYNPDGSTAQMTDGTGTTSYAYNAAGDLTQEATPEGTLSYSWDPAGNMSSVTYPGSHKAAYGYNSLDQMTSLTDWNSKTTDFKYDPAGNLSEVDYPNGTTGYYGYDSAERLDNVTVKTGSTLDFEFDASGPSGLGPNGDIQSLTTSQNASNGYGLTPGNGTGANAGTDAYAYDSLSRVLGDTETGPTGTTASTSETYSNNSEPLAEDVASGQNTLTYQSGGQDAGQITNVSSTGSFPWQYTSYDAAGNRTCEASSTPCSGYPSGVVFAYNGAGELAGTATGQSSTSCSGLIIVQTQECLAYDGNGNVATLDFTQGSNFNNQTLAWSTAGGSPWLAIYKDDSNGTTTTTDIMDGPNGLPIEQIQASTADWYYQDLSGNTRALLASSGALDQTYNYDDYGNFSYACGTCSGPQAPLLYQGLFTDTVDTGLVFMQARWYDPSTAQFMSQDPIVNQTIQPFAYAADDPINSADPSGLCNWPANTPPLSRSSWAHPGDRTLVKEGKDMNVPRPPQMMHKISVQDFVNMGTHRPPAALTPQTRYDRFGPLENQLWAVHGWVNCNASGDQGEIGGECKYKRSHGSPNDGDLIFNITARAGQTATEENSIHCEIPNDACTTGSPWQDQMADARNFMERHLPKARSGKLEVWVVGFGLWDTIAKDHQWHNGHWYSYGRPESYPPPSPELHPIVGINETHPVGGGAS